MTRRLARAAARDRRDDIGAISAVWMVLMLAAVWGGAALVFDGGRALAAERQASTVALGAARAAVSAENQLFVNGSPIDEGIATTAARDHAAAAGVDPGAVTVDTVVVDVVLVTKSAFLALGGIDTFTMHGHASARFAFKAGP
jgi:hypothetical protein